MLAEASDFDEKSSQCSEARSIASQGQDDCTVGSLAYDQPCHLPGAGAYGDAEPVENEDGDTTLMDDQEADAGPQAATAVSLAYDDPLHFAEAHSDGSESDSPSPPKRLRSLGPCLSMSYSQRRHAPVSDDPSSRTRPRA